VRLPSQNLRQVAGDGAVDRRLVVGNKGQSAERVGRGSPADEDFDLVGHAPGSGAADLFLDASPRGIDEDVPVQSRGSASASNPRMLST